MYENLIFERFPARTIVDVDFRWFGTEIAGNVSSGPFDAKAKLDCGADDQVTTKYVHEWTHSACCATKVTTWYRGKLSFHKNPQKKHYLSQETWFSQKNLKKIFIFQRNLDFHKNHQKKSYLSDLFGSPVLESWFSIIWKRRRPKPIQPSLSCKTKAWEWKRRTCRHQIRSQRTTYRMLCYEIDQMVSQANSTPNTTTTITTTATIPWKKLQCIAERRKVSHRLRYESQSDVSKPTRPNKFVNS